MRLSENQDASLSLLKIGIGHQVTLDAAIIDWNRIEFFSKRHGSLAVVCDGIATLPLPVRPQLTTWLRWMGEVIQGYEQYYVSYSKAITELAA